MSLRYIIYILILFLLVFSCEKNVQSTKLAQVYDKYLYLEDIQDIIPVDVNSEDSITIVKNKIDLWVRKETILKRAELYLTEDQKNIDKIVEDYKASLLIERYKQEYIKQEIDTSITQVEIEKYYNDYPESFKLNEEVVKVLFFKFSANKNIANFWQAYNTDNASEMILIAEGTAEKYDNFDNKWVEISTVLSLLPNNFTNAEAILNLSKKLQTRDKDYYYFVVFNEFKLKEEIIPLECIKDRIRIILLNKRKTNIVNQLENNIYQSDYKNGNIIFFTE